MRRLLCLLFALMLPTLAFAKPETGLQALTADYDYTLLETEIPLLLDKAEGLMTSEIIGQSVEGRSLYALTLGRGQAYVMILGGVHANEIGNPPMLMQAMWDLIDRMQKGNPDALRCLEKCTLVLVPCVNPDGYERTILLRQRGVQSKKKDNLNGVNLNRNFASPYWGSKRPMGNLDYPGPSAGSEPETKAVSKLMERYPYKAALDVHSQGRLIYYGKGGFLQEDVQTTLDVKALDARGKTMAKAICPKRYRVQFQTPESKKTKYGSTTDYLFALGVPGITIETMGKGEYTIGKIAAEYARIDFPSLLIRLGDVALEFEKEDEAAK